MMALIDTQQFKTGKQVEAFLDDYYRKMGYVIRQTTQHEEQALCLGDRQFSINGSNFFVEYKSGIQTFYTKNIFLETISVDTAEPQKPGWVYTCLADYILYACVLNFKILIFQSNLLRAKMPHLKRQFREVKTSKGQNTGYNTHGLIVPLAYAEKYVADKIILIEDAFLNHN